MIDTDISPEAAEVWLDGAYVGVADDFDGRPDFLYLKPGKYLLELRLAGYESYGIDLDVSLGERVNLDTKMRRTGVRDGLDPQRRPMPSGRMFEPGGRSVAERVDDATASDLEADLDSSAAARYDREPARKRSEGVPAVTGDTGRLRIHVTPDDAAVYLDDRLIGTGEDLSANSRGVRTDAGRHTITVVRPGFKTKTLEVEALAGQGIDVAVELER